MDVLTVAQFVAHVKNPLRPWKPHLPYHRPAPLNWGQLRILGSVCDKFFRRPEDAARCIYSLGAFR